MADARKILDELLPDKPVIDRADIESVGLCSKGSMANLDSRDLGPPRVEWGGKAKYEREALIDWAIERYERSRRFRTLQKKSQE